MPRTASIKKRADGNYQRSISIGRKPDGKPIRKTIYAKTLKELETRAAEYERQLKQGTLPSNDKMTFGELAKMWVESYKPNISDKSRDRYRSVLDLHILPQLSHIKLKDLKPHNLQAIINEMAEDNYSERTMNEVKNTASNIMEVAMDNDLIFRNVFRKIEVPHVDSVERRALMHEEIDLITRTYKDHRMGVPAMIMLYCGLRRGEMLALTLNDIDIKSGLISVNKAVHFDKNAPHIKTPKSKAGFRKVPIPQLLVSILQDMKTKSLFICPSAKGSMMTQTAFKAAWNSYLHYLNIRAGGKDASRSRARLQAIDNITAHMLRHTYATMLYDAGVDVKSAQKFLGHADIETTLRIYTHLSEEKEEKAIDALNIHLEAFKG